MTMCSLYSPNTPRRTSQISPTVAYSRTASRMGGIRFASPSAAVRNAFSVRATASPLLRARSAGAMRPAPPARGDRSAGDSPEAAPGSGTGSPPRRSCAPPPPRADTCRPPSGSPSGRTRLDGIHHAAERIDLRDQAAASRSMASVIAFHEVRPSQRIRRIRHPAFERDDLLGPQRDADRVLARQREGLVAGIGVEALGPAQEWRPASGS